MKRRLSQFDWGYLAAAILPIIGILPVLSKSGILFSADGAIHVYRIDAMSQLVQAGNLWPRWIPYFHLGYGYPVFDFYPPLSYQLGSLLSLVGISAAVAFNLILSGAWMMGSLGVYALARQWLPGRAAILAVVLWAFAPMRMHEVYHQGSLPTMLALGFVPWVFWGIARLTRSPNARNMVPFTLPLTGLVLSHQPVTFITGLFAAPAAALLALWGIRHEPRLVMRRLLVLVGGLMCAVGLAAIFLLPMVAELRYISASEQASDVIAYLRSNYLQPHEIFATFQPHDLTDLWGSVPTSLGLVPGILSVLGLLGLLRRKQYAPAAILAVAIAVLVFMLTENSLPVWQAIPYLAQIRFALRFVSVGALFVALAGGASILLLPRSWQIAGLGLAILVAVGSTLPLAYINPNREQWDNMTAEDEIQHELDTYAWGTTSYDEFDPVWGDAIPLDPPPEPYLYQEDPLRIVVKELDIIKQFPDLRTEQLDTETTRVTVSDARPVRFRQYYFPGWRATLDGQPVEVYPDQQYGMLTVDVPAGQHDITLHYAGTSAQTIGALVSLISVVVMGGIWYTTRHSDQTESRPESLSQRVALAIIVGAVGFALLDVLVIRPHTLLFRRESPPDSPAYMETSVHQSFGGEFELLGFTLHQDHVAPDGLLNVTLYWRPLHEITREYHPVVQLIDLSMSTAWASVEPLSMADLKTPGLMPDKFVSDPYAIRVFDSAPPYVGRITVQLRDAETGEFLRLPDGSDRVVLEPLIRITGSGEASAKRFDYRIGDAVDLRCASVSADGNQYRLSLYWHVRQTPSVDLVTLLHGLDENGTLVVQNDMLPIPEYPTSLWLPGQNLVSEYTLPAEDTIHTVGVGLYDPAGDRLLVTDDGKPVADNIIRLPLTEYACLP